MVGASNIAVTEDALDRITATPEICMLELSFSSREQGRGLLTFLNPSHPQVRHEVWFCTEDFSCLEASKTDFTQGWERMCSFGSEMSDPLGGCTTDPVSCNCTHTSVLYTSSRTDPRGLQIPKPEGLVWGLGDIEVGYLQQNSHEERVKVPSLMAPATLSFFFFLQM